MAHGAVKHDYHLVNPSPWPIVASISLFTLALGAVMFMKGLLGVEKGTWWPMLIGLGGIIYSMIGWWSDVVKESRQGDHTPVVQIGLRYGMVLFIASEVMFFAGWFWAFFEMAIWHDVRATMFDTVTHPQLAEWTDWPPPGVTQFDPFHLPLMNTLILLLSGTTVTWAHHAIQQGDRKSATTGLLLTVLLGAGFTAMQIYEYTHAEFSFAGNLYGATFFMATGFHGAHVFIGTVFLAVCLFRIMAGHMSQQKHLGFEFAAWYWHFVDVVWLFLFAFVYVVPYVMM